MVGPSAAGHGTRDGTRTAGGQGTRVTSITAKSFLIIRIKSNGAHGTARIWKGKAEDRKPQAQEAIGKMEEPQVEKEKEMSEIIILASLVLIVGLLGFIALMVFIIGSNIDKHIKK